MLIAEDLLLLAFDDDAGKPIEGVNNLGYSLAGALLIELAQLGRVDITTENEANAGKPGRLAVRDDAPTGNPMLDEALSTLADHEGRKPKDAIGPLSRGDLETRLLSGLAERGILRREDSKILKLFPVTRWPAVDSRHEEQTRAELTEALVGGRVPGERAAALIALLAGMGVVGRAVEADDPKAVERRATEIAEGNWAGHAARRAVEQVTVAVLAAVFVPTIVTAGTD